jgi:transposase InsO family protein
MFALLKGEQWAVSRETVRRLRKRAGLQVVKRARKRRPRGTSTTVPTRATSPNQVWSYDCVHDETTDGRRLKCLTVLDEYTREGLTIHGARSITAGDVVQVLQRLFVQRGLRRMSRATMAPSLLPSGLLTGGMLSMWIPPLLPRGARGKTGITRASMVSFAMAA